MSIKDNKLTARQWIDEVWNRGSVSLVDEMCSEDYIQYTTQSAEPSEEDARYTKKWITDIRRAFPDFRIATHEVIAENKKIAIRFSACGTHMKRLLGAHPTQRKIVWHGAMILVLKKKRIKRMWILPDHGTFFSQPAR